MSVNSLSTLEEISYYRLRHPETFLIVDTNILLLFFIGIFDSNYLAECPLMTENGKYYCAKHFELLKDILKIFTYKLAITPHILSEINMLSRKSVKPKDRMNELFLKIIQQLDSFNEHHTQLQIIIKNNALLDFGFADISLTEAATQNKWTILTDEIQLYKMFRDKMPIIYFSSVVANDIYMKQI